MRKEMTVVDKLQRTFDNLPQEKKDRINRILENYEETVFSTPHEPNNEDRLEQEITTLREQVEKLTKEGIEYREKWLSEQSRNLSEEAEFEILSQQVVALEYLSVVDTAAIENLHEQLAGLAEQNEKMRKVLLRLACLGNGDQYGNSIGNCIAKEALSLPDLATPVLNKYRAEGIRMAAEICETTFAHGILQLGHRAAIAKAIRAKADELEQSK